MGVQAGCGVEEGLARVLGGAGPARFAHGHRVETFGLHRGDQRRRERRLPRPLRAFEDEEEAAAHERVMMLLAAPFSMPAAICSFTRAITLSKFARATT